MDINDVCLCGGTPMLLLLREPAPERNRAWSGDGLNSLVYLIVASYFFSNLLYSGNYISLRERAISLTIKVLDNHITSELEAFSQL